LDCRDEVKGREGKDSKGSFNGFFDFFRKNEKVFENKGAFTNRG
jgi:hypothetical protein